LAWGTLVLGGAGLAGLFVAAQPPASQHTLKREKDQLVLASPSGFQTVSMIDGGRTGFYYDSATDLLRGRASVSSVVLLGLGGGEMLRQAGRQHPQAQLTGLEIDPTTAHLARTTFAVPGAVVVADALAWVDMPPAETFSVVMVDLYEDSEMVEGSARLTFLAACYRLLEPGGLYMQNVWPASRAAEVTRVLRTLYPVVHRRAYGANVVLFAEKPR
jgi:spermidine synthase